MATETEIRQELAGEREELGHVAERGKKVGAAVGAAAGAAAAAKLLLRLRRR
jgi:hypothetical protein